MFIYNFILFITTIAIETFICVENLHFLNNDIHGQFKNIWKAKHDGHFKFCLHYLHKVFFLNIKYW